VRTAKEGTGGHRNDLSDRDGELKRFGEEGEIEHQQRRGKGSIDMYEDPGKNILN